MNNSIARLQAEIEASRAENTSLQQMLSSLHEQMKVQQENLQAATSNNNQQLKW